MSALLMSERFVAVFPSLVKALGGLPEATITQEIHYQIQVGGRNHEGQVWVPATVQNLADAIGISKDAVTRSCRHLRDIGVLVTANPEAFQRRTWWRINYDVLLHLAKSQNASSEIASSQVAKSPNPKSGIASSSTTKETKKVDKEIAPSDENDDVKFIPTKENAGNSGMLVKLFIDKFLVLYYQTPDQQLIGRVGRDAKRMLGQGRTFEELKPAVLLCAELGHGNLPSAYTQLLAKGRKKEPKGFNGIREFLQDSE